jgi:hypothetical protein
VITEDRDSDGERSLRLVAFWGLVFSSMRAPDTLFCWVEEKFVIYKVDFCTL